MAPRTRRLFLVVLLFGCSEAPTAAPFGTFVQPVINGTVAAGLYTGVAARGSGCSSVLVARRVLLTSAHCVESHALACATVAQSPLTVTFAEPGGGWANQASFDARTRFVRGLAVRPELFDLGQCPPNATYNCQTPPLRPLIDHSRELVVLYLEEDAPADVSPLPILIASSVDTSHSAAEIGIFHGLENWVNAVEPVVTTVGYGVGSHAYGLSGGEQRGRDYGQQNWIATETNFGGLLGADDCGMLASSSMRPGIVVSPKDLGFAEIGDPKTVPPGTQYPGFQHSHSGGGDSGGPVLVGAGPAARGDSPTSLPAPAPDDSFDPGKNYIVGTASLWLGSSKPKTAFTPTWTHAAATFLVDALRDSDGDGFADPVDDDSDNDTCDDDVDQHSNQGSEIIGTILHLNCQQQSSPWYVWEGSDSDGDGLKNCEDPNDDNDAFLDEDDDCPVHAGWLCSKVGEVCPWNPLFFDCLFGGCKETLRFGNVINPDPTRVYSFPIQSAAQRVVVVSPAPGLSVERSAALLSGQSAATARGSGTSDLFLLEVVGPDRRVLGSIAAYDSKSARVGDLRGAKALELRFDASGQAIEILGARVAPDR